MFYKQCLIEHGSEEAKSEHVAWIPENLAVVGKPIRIKDEKGWRDGYVVKQAYAHRKTVEEINDATIAHKRFGPSIQGRVKSLGGLTTWDE